MFFKKEYKVIGRRAAGTDPFSSETFYVNDYKAVMVPMWSHIMVVIIAIMITIVGIIGASIVLSSNDTAVISNVNAPTTTMVEEVTTTVAEVTAITVQEEVAVAATKYVCDTDTSSQEYIIQVATMMDETTYDIPWETMRDRHIVLQWGMDNIYLDEFKADVAMFVQYTHMDVRVVDSSYVPTSEDYLVPVIKADIEGMAWADMNVGVSVSDVFGIRVVDINSAVLRFDQRGLDNWEYHTHMVLHELGHMVGLGHTHKAEGEQTESVMSYESDQDFAGYMAGDIAGLQEVLCK
jgi:hypothetical protein